MIYPPIEIGGYKYIVPPGQCVTSINYVLKLIRIKNLINLK